MEIKTQESGRLVVSEAESTMLVGAGLPELLDHVAVLSWLLWCPWTLDSDPPVSLNHFSSLPSSPSRPRWSLAQGDNEGKRAGLPAAKWGVFSLFMVQLLCG